MKEYFLKRPLALTGAFSCIAVCIGYYSNLFLIVFAMILLTVIIYLIINNCDKKYVIASAIILLTVISVLMVNKKAHILSDYSGKEDKCRFTVKEITYKSSNYCSASIEITDSEFLKRGTKISLRYYSDILEMGDNATAVLRFESLKNDKYKSFNYSNGNFLAATSENIVINTDRPDRILKVIYSVRNYIKETLFDNLSFNEAATVMALILGDDTYFTDEFRMQTRAAGVSHVMVVSGMHLSLTVMAATYFIEKIFYNKYIRSIIIVLVVIFMMGVCGFTTSMIRAGVTYLIMAIGISLNRRAEPVNALGGAVSIILIASPYTILSVGFELSVLSTLGVMAVAQPVVKYANGKLLKSKLLFSLFSQIIATLSSMLFTLPISISAFECIPLLSVITNLAISFAVSGILWLSLSGLFIFNINSDFSGMVFSACEWLTAYVNKCICFFGSQKFSVVNIPKYYTLIAVLGVFVIIYVLLACKKQKKMLQLKKYVKGGKV